MTDGAAVAILCKGSGGRNGRQFYILFFLIMLAMALVGCAVAPPRNAVPLPLVDKADVPDFDGVRFWGDELPRNMAELARERLSGIERLAVAQPRDRGRPIVNILALSGGGADGAFGAGLLNGWSEAGTRPRFEIVTGVSAGAIIAPFAFLGARDDDHLEEFFTQYSTDDLLRRQVIAGFLGGTALADSKPLANLITKYVDRPMLDDIAREYRQGRLLLIGTTNLDAQRPVIWNMGAIAASGTPEALTLFRQVILASASIPGVFPPVHIKVKAGGRIYEEMHVDGGPTRQVFVAPAQLDLRSFDRFYSTPPVRRIFVIRNAKLAPQYEPVKPNTLAIGTRTVSTLILSESQGDLLRIYTIAQRAGADFNLAAIPSSFDVPSKEPFDRAYMQALFKLGERFGRGGAPWLKAPPK